MDFFKYASYAWGYTDTIWVPFLVGGLCFAIVFIFEAIALFTIATRAGYKNKWMAFVPFLNTYYIGVCAQKNKFYNIASKKIGTTAAVFEFVLCVMYILYFVACELISKCGVMPTLTTEWLGEAYFYPLEAVPQNLKWAAWMYNYMDAYILLPLSLVFTLLQISLLISFFQTYACRRYVLFTITSILFPIQGILFFVVRNNKGVNYREFVRTEQAKQYQMYQQYYNQNPYNQNPYSQNPSGRNPYSDVNQPNGGSHSGSSDDPFGDLGGTSGTNGTGGSNYSGGSPFDEFDNN